ncbi:hypothetical protein U9M48_015925 [Paspalum notatum var. saurae]|uniref:Uncharacterized protein n=1 Tax=Paspalum notatum var. saurae TaxID=547442 RepID=A0AAQ3WMJ4_PASNO
MANIVYSTRPDLALAAARDAISWTNLSRLSRDDPPGATAALAFSFHSAALLLAAAPLPSSAAMSSLTAASTWARPTSRGISSPTPHSTHAYRALVTCSEKKGQQRSGTPARRLSRVEFQPQWLRKPPVAGCSSTASWSHHPTVSPRAPTASANPSGSAHPDPAAPPSRTMSGRTTHRNGHPEAASPHANSSICSLVTTVMLPKLTYTTDAAPNPLPSSHAAHRSSSLHRLDVSDGRYDGGYTSGPSGPTVKVLGRRARVASRARRSRSSKVLRRMPSATGASSSHCLMMMVSMVSSGSVVRMNVGRSRRRAPGSMPPIQSTGVSRHVAPHDELIKVEVRHEAAGAVREEEVRRQAHLLGDVHGIPHGAVGDDAADRRDAVRAVQPLHERPDGGRSRPARGLAERPDVLRGIQAGRREAVGDGLEPEALGAGDVEGAGAPRAEEPAVVVLGVDEGDVEAARVQRLGQLQERVHVALRRVGDQQRVRLGRLRQRRRRHMRLRALSSSGCFWSGCGEDGRKTI